MIATLHNCRECTELELVAAEHDVLVEMRIVDSLGNQAVRESNACVTSCPWSSLETRPFVDRNKRSGLEAEAIHAWSSAATSAYALSAIVQ